MDCPKYEGRHLSEWLEILDYARCWDYRDGTPAPDAELAKSAERIVLSLGPADKAAIPTLVRHGLTRAVRDTVVKLLMRTDFDKFVAELAASLAEPRHAETAAQVFQELGMQACAAVPALVESVRSQHAAIRLAAITALEAMSTAAEPAVPGLVECLQSSDKDERIRAATLLGKIGAGAKDAVPALTRAVDEESSSIMPALLNEVLGADSQWVMPALSAAAVCTAAVRALGAIGPVAQGAVPVLLTARARLDQAEASLANRPGARISGTKAVFRAAMSDAQRRVRAATDEALRSITTEADAASNG